MLDFFFYIQYILFLCLFIYRRDNLFLNHLTKHLSV